MALLGMRGTGTWTNEERPKSFREGMLLLFPNGSVTLTGIQAMGKSETTDDPEFKYYSKTLQTQTGTYAASTSLFLNEGLSVGATGTKAAGTILYIKVAAADVIHARGGHTLLIATSGDDANRLFCKVLTTNINGSSSYIQVKTLVATPASGFLVTADTFEIIGSVNAEGGTIPDAISYDADKFSNLTQIFRTPLEITRTMRKTRLYTGDEYLERLRESMQYHGIEMEKALLWGEKTENTGTNNQPERTTQGIVSFIEEHNSSNVIHYFTDTSLAWKVGGEDFINEKLEQLFRFGRTEKLAICGSGAVLGINQIVADSGLHTLTAKTLSFGLQVVEWVTPFGTLFLKLHPLYTQVAHRRYSMTILEPENLTARVITDTMFKEDKNESKGGQDAVDGTKEEWLTELGWEYHFAETYMHLSGIGLDS